MRGSRGMGLIAMIFAITAIQAVIRLQQKIFLAMAGFITNQSLQ